MWKIWISDTRRGKVIFETNYQTTADLNYLQGSFHNGLSMLVFLQSIQEVAKDELRYLFNRYVEVTRDVFYFDIQKVD